MKQPLMSVKVNIPAPVWKKLKEKAASDCRSAHSLIIYYLTKAVGNAKAR